MSLFNNTVTIYCYHQEPVSRAENWLRTVIKGIQQEERQEKNINQQGVISITKSIEVTIPEEADTKGQMYIDVNKWRNMPVDDLRGKYWTIDAVSNMSIVVLGGIDAEITPEYTITDLMRDYSGAAVISSFTDATNAAYLRHWRIEGN